MSYNITILPALIIDPLAFFRFHGLALAFKAGRKTWQKHLKAKVA